MRISYRLNLRHRFITLRSSPLSSARFRSPLSAAEKLRKSCGLAKSLRKSLRACGKAAESLRKKLQRLTEKLRNCGDFLRRVTRELWRRCGGLKTCEELRRFTDRLRLYYYCETIHVRRKYNINLRISYRLTLRYIFFNLRSPLLSASLRR